MKKIIFISVFLIISCSSNKSTISTTHNGYRIKNSQGEIINIPSDEKNSLESDFFSELKNYLSEIVNYKLDFSKKIVINFIDNDPRGNITNYRVPWDIFYGNLSDDLNEIENCNHIWIKNIQVENLYYYHGNKIKWVTDKNNLIRSKFFKYNGLNGGFLILKPDGQYYLKVGEYTKLGLLKTYESEK